MLIEECNRREVGALLRNIVPVTADLVIVRVVWLCLFYYLWIVFSHRFMEGSRYVGPNLYSQVDILFPNLPLLRLIQLRYGILLLNLCDVGKPVLEEMTHDQSQVCHKVLLFRYECVLEL